MKRHAIAAAVLLLLTAKFLGAQHPYFQLAGGGAIGARYASGSTRGGVFPAGAIAFGLEWRTAFVRVDARAFDTEAEPLLAFGVAVGLPLVRVPIGQAYLLGGAGAGLFVEEGDPGQHVGVGLGFTAGRPLGLYAELRHDYLVGDFTYAARRRGLTSLIAGVRIGTRRL